MRLTGMVAAVVAGLAWNMALAAEQPLVLLTKQLESGILDEQISAAHTLGEIGLRAATTVPALIKSLKNEDLALRHEVVVALGRINSNAELVIPALIQVLSDKSPLLQHGAIESLRLFGPDANAALPQLRKFLDEKDALLKVSAARAITDIAPLQNEDPKKVIAVLIAGLTQEKSGIHPEAIQGLVSIGAPAVPAIQTLLETPTSKTSVLACDTLARIGPSAASATDRLLKLTNSPNVEVRWHALRALGAIGAKPEQIVPVLTKHLKSDSAIIRLHSAKALGNLGPAGATATSALIAALKDTDVSVRRAAASSLGDIGPSASEAVPALVAALDDEKGTVTLDAVESLGKMGKAAVPALVEKLKEAHFQHLVLTVLGQLGPDAAEATPALVGLIEAKNPDVGREAILTLASIGSAAKSAVPELLKTLNDKQSANRPAAAYALGHIGAMDAAPALRSSLDASNDPLLGLAGIWALLQLDPTNEEYAKIAVPRLTAALTNERPRIRREAATALGKLGSHAKSAVTALQKAMYDSDPEVRTESLVALAEIGPDSNPAIPDIIQLLVDDDRSHHPTACYALGRIGPASKVAVPHLRRLLQSRDAVEKTVAAWALVKVAPDQETIQIAIPLLIAALQKAERIEMRAEAATTLGEIGIDSQAARAALTAAKSDADGSVRKAAEVALSKLK